MAAVALLFLLVQLAVAAHHHRETGAPAGHGKAGCELCVTQGSLASAPEIQLPDSPTATVIDVPARPAARTAPVPRHSPQAPRAPPEVGHI